MRRCQYFSSELVRALRLPIYMEQFRWKYPHVSIRIVAIRHWQISLRTNHQSFTDAVIKSAFEKTATPLEGGEC